MPDYLIFLRQNKFMVLTKLSKNKIYSLLFLGYFIFMGTTLRLTLGLTSLSFIVNALIILLPILIIVWSFRSVTLNLHDICMSFVTSLMVLIPLLNMFIYSRSYIGAVQTSSFIFSWLVLLSVLFNQEFISKNQDKFWRWFNKLSVILISLGLFEYVACIFFNVVPPYIETSNGNYLVGWFTVFYALDPFTPHFRFYGPFGEPGELAMWSSVLIFYNLLRKNYLALAILCIAAFAAFSPSILISIFIGFIFHAIKKKSIFYLPLIIILITLLFFFFGSYFLDFIQEVLNNKERSLASRYDSTFGFFSQLGFLITNYPLGIPAFETTAEAYASGISFAANFSAITAYERGGIIVFALYLLLLSYGAFNSILAILGSKRGFIFNEIYLYYLILLPFVIQRESLFELGVFPLLFGSVFFRKLKRSQKITV